MNVSKTFLSELHLSQIATMVSHRKRHHFCLCFYIRNVAHYVMEAKTFMIQRRHIAIIKSSTAVQTVQRHSDLKLQLWRLFQRNFPFIENPAKGKLCWSQQSKYSLFVCNNQLIWTCYFLELLPNNSV